MVQSIHCCFNCRNMYVQLHSFMSKQERLVVLNSLKVPLIISCKCVGALRMNIWTPVNPDNPSNHRTSVGRPPYVHSGCSGVRMTSVSGPMDVPCTPAGRPVLSFPYAQSDVRNRLYFGWSVKISRITRQSNLTTNSTVHSARLAHYRADGIHEHSKLALHHSLAVLNSYISSPKEIVVGVGEELQKNFKIWPNITTNMQMKLATYVPGRWCTKSFLLKSTGAFFVFAFISNLRHYLMLYSKFLRPLGDVIQTCTSVSGCPLYVRKCTSIHGRTVAV